MKLPRSTRGFASGTPTQRQWEAVHRVTATLHGHDRVEELAQQTLLAAAESVSAGAGCLLLHEPQHRSLVYMAALGPWSAALVGRSLPDDRGLVGSVFQAGEGRITLDLGTGRRPQPARSRRGAATPRPTLLTAPLVTPRGEAIGVLQLLDRQEGVFDAEDLAVVTTVGALAAAAIDTARRRERRPGGPEARERQVRLEQELAIGRRIQMSLLPPSHLLLPSFEIVSRSEPATEVGGDFFNLFEAKGETFGVVLGDVAGSGVPAALFMAVTTTLIPAQARFLASPAATLAAANAELYPKTRPPGGASPLFVTVLYGVLDPRTREIRLANAGQTPPIHWPAGGAPRYLRVKGLPLGALLQTRYEEIALVLDPGDRLLFCSDGFIEATDAAGRTVGYAGFLRQLEAMAQRQGAELVAALFDAGGSAPAGGKEADDRTVVLLTVTSDR